MLLFLIFIPLFTGNYEVRNISKLFQSTWALATSPKYLLKIKNVMQMKKIFILFSLCVLPSAFVHSQTEVESDCKSNVENIFKVRTLKIRYEAVQYLYKEIEEKRKFPKEYIYLNNYFQEIKGFSMDSSEEMLNLLKTSQEERDKYFEQKRDSISRSERAPLKWMSEEEMNRFVELLNCTPKEALKEYENFIQNIKLEKEIYLKCIDAEIAKGDLSEYANNDMIYGYLPFMQSFIPIMTPLNYLKVFKEFILKDDEDVLPDYTRVRAYLKCGFKIP